MSRFPRLSKDEAELLNACLDITRRYWAKLLPHDSADRQARILRLQMRLAPWLAQKQFGGDNGD